MTLTLFGITRLGNKLMAQKAISPERSKASLQRTSSRVQTSSFADSPAIIRSAQSMKKYYDLDYAMQKHLDSAGAGPSRLADVQPPRQPDQVVANGLMGTGSGYLSFTTVPHTNSVPPITRLKGELDDAMAETDCDASLSLAYLQHLGVKR